MPDLFHVTRLKDKDSIIRHGLRPGSKAPAEKKAEEMVEEAGGDPETEFYEDPPDVKADRMFDRIIRHAAGEAGITDFPPHDNAVFFWPRRKDAMRAGTNTPGKKAIVAVERDRMPDHCDFATGDHHELSWIWDECYQMHRHGTGTTEEELMEAAIDWWQDVYWYDGTLDFHTQEVWTGCSVPPQAIEYIEDVQTGRRIYETPADPSLFDFIGGEGR